MAETCPKCSCKLDLAEGEGTDCCCGFKIERREGQLVALATSADAGADEGAQGS